MSVTVFCFSIILLEISPLLAQKDPHFLSNRSVIVHLHEWKWTDIADECERFLQYKGYAGVQVSPPNENIIANERPWWERYQPVSYNLTTRSGNKSQFADMVTRCNAVGIRIYADVVINHMAALTGIGTAGNSALSDMKMYPAVPYSPEQFHPTCTIQNYLNPEIVRNCEINNYRDLDQSNQQVRAEISQYLNGLIDMGVAGFRIDSAKYMWPNDLQEIYTQLNSLNETFGFAPNSKAFLYQDVPIFDNDVVGNEEYISIGTVIEFKYSPEISRVFTGKRNLSELVNWGPDWGFIPQSQDAVVFVDAHNNQRKEGILNYKTLKQYKMALAFMLAHDYGIPRIISSYFFNDKDIGPPQDTSGNIKSPIIYSDGSCGNGYVCEHRWLSVSNMIEFKNVVNGTMIENWWTNENYTQQIAFSRGDRGFVAFSNEGDFKENIQTSLSPGTYCDVITGSLTNGTCTGKSFVIDSKGVAAVSISEDDYNGVVAIHVNSKLKDDLIKRL